jgi:hypothetical protein
MFQEDRVSCAMYHTMDSDPSKRIFIIITHGMVFSYFGDTDTFSQIPDEVAHDWLDEVARDDLTNPWWKRIL